MYQEKIVINCSKKRRRMARALLASSLLLLTLQWIPTGEAAAPTPDRDERQVTGQSSRSLAGADLEPFKITPVYDPSFSRLSLQQQVLIRDALLAAATSWFSRVLKVRPLRSSIKFDRECVGLSHYLVNNQRYCGGGCAAQTKCGPATIPERHLNPCRRCDADGNNCEEVGGSQPGVTEGTFLLYVSAVEEPARCSRGYTAYGKHCLQEEDFDRPVAGYLNFCPSRVSTDHAHFDQQLSIVLHELLHILVFSDELFPFYHNEDGFPQTHRTEGGKPINHFGRYTVSLNTLRSVRRLHWSTVNEHSFHSVEMIVTPNVVREVRAHFGCPSLIGAELENQGGQGAARIHWEKRIFGDELMSASPGSTSVISRITLALLEDSGWYRADYRYGGRLQWGHHRGCAFVNGSCRGWMNYAKDRRIELAPFCDERDWRLRREGCLDHRTQAGPCMLKNYSLPLPTEYQYFNRRKGGSQAIADFCPLFYATEYQRYRVGKNCRNPDHAPKHDHIIFIANEDGVIVHSYVNVALEVFGHNSRCFEQGRPFEMRFSGTVVSQSTYGAGCYEFSCSANRVFIHVGNQHVRCSREGQKNRIQYTVDNVTYEGTLVCPDYNELCSEYDCLNMCSDHGTCVGGYCKCHPGYHGDDCSRSYLERLLNCRDVSCQNGGNCSDSDVGFSCTCPAGFTGSYCQSELVPDPCTDSPCGTNGSCVRTRGGRAAECLCFEGYVGATCGDLRDYCRESGMPCENGRCRNETTSPSCVCDPGYTGRRCRLRENFCIPNLCQNNSTCVSHLSTQTFSCQCLSGFMGERCEIRTADPCQSQPCANGGTCQNLNGTGIQCTCPVGYQGDRCMETVTDHCADSPCLNGGTCTNVESGFECSCARGYKGLKCRKRTNPCKPNPCQNEGKCKKEDGAPYGQIRCECRTGYLGPLCEHSV